MTPLSKSLEELITDIYQDGNVSVAEYRTLRDDADRRMDAVIKEFGLHNNVTAFQKSIDVAMQLLQTTVVDAKKARLTDTGEAIVKDAVTAQVEYLRAGSELALRLL
ncbi:MULTISPECIES: hypothetical protein [unclassified Pseudomonas]|uniref:hypothetical protein n=1 Tax=unclassified Pseudomonas TaxID=196821 RepID=UPI0008D2A5B5|nr:MULTISPECIES: hypothetical protein [unclassified Pseudomonas]PMV17796.1 hypothetical protein C1X17_28780 [Pseudomonas sp. FW305-3-2-15-C-TSA2]PMV19413.1 hypothetical protein C1X22_28605 [Pseudomonas sp. DP16D-L5]PMV33077.1 hypothetical protein C1X21_29325 [Pseudomonas sp. FW305-3-2-15-A-LB2]PMV38347.1 hypothetical protein C1X16_29245 [Pseudomonas sp. FW305-3-2-15-C-R2A1]PMV43009.1 hypothetical protein C1X18_28980 [Pseudomonas sp. FW305-3-2-15-C-LB1]